MVLVISLIFLLIISLYALAKARNIQLDERIAANNKLQHEVFVIADSGLEEAKSVVASTSDFTNPISGTGNFAGGTFAYTIEKTGKQPASGQVLLVTSVATKATATRTLQAVVAKNASILALDGVISAY